MRQETQWTTIFWEGWTALALCAAAVFWPGSAALGYPAVLWPGLALAAAVPVLWAGWWLWAEKAPPLPEEELMAETGRYILLLRRLFCDDGSAASRAGGAGDVFSFGQMACAPRGPEAGRGVSNPPSLPLDSTLPATS